MVSDSDICDARHLMPLHHAPLQIPGTTNMVSEMTENQKILTEILSLLTEQIEELQKELTPDLIVRYADRDRRIRVLVERITVPQKTG